MTPINSKAIFITGGSGFIGKRLVKKLVEEDNPSIYLLVRPQSQEKVNQFLSKLKPGSKVRMVLGDLRQKNLGLNPKDLKEIKEKINVIYHLGAAYYFNLTKNEAQKANYHGTRNLLKLASQMKKLKLFNHVSTALVCGNREGIILEDKLIAPLGFRNVYEESKFQAEKLVRQASSKLPIIIFRPSIVVGDSRTGETDKFNGTYKLIGAIAQRKLLFYSGSCQAPLNIVPVDFVVRTMVAISSQKRNIGKTFHLCDANPLTARQFINLVCELSKVRKPLFSIPVNFLNLLFSIPFLEKYAKIKKSSLSLLNQNFIFDTTNTKKALKEARIKVPRIEKYLPNILKYYQKHKDD